MRRDSQRAAWTAFVQGSHLKTNKYGNERGKRYASKYEAEIAMKLWALESRGIITELREQVSFTLVEGNGKIRPIRYVADFVYVQDGKRHIVDAKGCKTPVYRLKRKMAVLLHGIEIEEV
jgi:hypothetical protein